MNTVQAYQKSIELLIRGSLNYEDLIIRLAQQDPETFVKLVENENFGSAPVKDLAEIKPPIAYLDFCKIVLECMTTNKKIEATKHIKNYYSLELKSALDIADSLQNELANITTKVTYYDNQYNKAVTLDSRNREIVRELFATRGLVGL